MTKKKNLSPRKSFLENIIGWGIICVFAVLPLVYYSDRAASYVTSKQYFLIGIVDVLVVLWVWLLLVDKRYRLTKKNMFFLAPLCLFLASMTISGFVGVDLATSFFSIVESGTGLILLYHVFLFVCILTSFIRVQQKTFLKYILQANLFASIVLAVMTFLTGPTGLIDIHSTMLNGSVGGATMGNSLLAGAYLLLTIFLTLYLISQESKLWKKIVYWISIALIILCPVFFNVAIFKGTAISSSYLFIGQARIATVALIIGLFIALFIWLNGRKDSKLWHAIGLIGILVMVIAGGIGIQQIANPTSRIHAFFVTESGNRLSDWQEAVQGIETKPFFGWGPENYHVVHQLYLNPIVYSPGHSNEVWALHPHNNTLEVLVDGGIIGFIFYLLTVVAMFYGLFTLRRTGKIDDKTFALFMAMLIAFIIQQQMIYDSIVSYTVFFSLLGILAGLIDSTDDQRQANTGVDTSSYTIGITIVVIMIPIWIYAAYLPSQKMDEFLTTTTLTSDVRAKVYQHLFYSAGSYAIDTDPEFFTDPFFYSYDAQRVMLKTNPQYQQLSSTEITALIAAVNPLWQQKYYDYHLTISLLDLENLHFYLTGNKQDLIQAEMYAKRAFVLSPTDPQLYFVYAQTLEYEGNTAGAIAQLDKALVINSTYQPAMDFKKNLQQLHGNN